MNHDSQDGTQSPARKRSIDSSATETDDKDGLPTRHELPSGQVVYRATTTEWIRHNGALEADLR